MSWPLVFRRILDVVSYIALDMTGTPTSTVPEIGTSVESCLHSLDAFASFLRIDSPCQACGVSAEHVALGSGQHTHETVPR